MGLLVTSPTNAAPPGVITWHLTV